MTSDIDGLNLFGYDDLCIGQINLAALARAYKVINMFLHASTSGGGCEEKAGLSSDLTTNRVFVDWLVSEGPYSQEREIALQMVFEEATSAPRYLEMLDETFERRLIDLNEEEKCKEVRTRQTLCN